MKFLLFNLLLLINLTWAGQAQAFNIFPWKNYRIPSMSESFDTFGQSQIGALDSNQINIFVWNVYKGKKSNWKFDYPLIVNSVDLLMLQEVYLDKNMEDTLLQTPFEYNFGISFIYGNKNDTPTGTAIGSRIQPLNSYFFRSSDKEPIIKTPKTITYAFFPIKNYGKDLLLLNIHGVNFTRDKMLQNQIIQTEEIIKSHNGPIIFAGDFNTRTKRRLRETRKFMKSLGLEELKFEGQKRKAFLGNTLDLAFVKGLEVLSQNVLEDINSSDHKALWFSVKVK